MVALYVIIKDINDGRDGLCMNLFQSLLYGIISGISQFLPVPSFTNQAVLLKLFGLSHRDHLCDAVVHIGILISLMVSAKNLVEQVKYDPSRRSIHRGRNSYNVAESRFSKNASYITVIMVIVFLLWIQLEMNYLLISVLLLVNGFIMYLPSRMYQGNKDARTMTVLDSILIGAGNALLAIPGFSGVGCGVSIAMMRGADRQSAVNWMLILGIPTLIVLIGADIVLLFANLGAIVFGNVFGYLLAGATAYIGGYLGIIILKLLAKRAGFYGFTFYSWGLALFMLILFLI